MASTIDVDRFRALCGGLVFAEEYKGNLRAAQDEIERCRREGIPDDPEQHAELLCCIITLSTLSGRISDAYNAVDELKALLERLPPHWGLRYTVQKPLVDYIRKYPPSLRFQHESMMPIDLPMLSDIKGPGDITQELQENFRLYFATSTPRDQAACLFLQGLLYFPLQLRSLTTKLHPLYPDGDWKMKDSLSPDTAIAQMAPNLPKLKQRAVAANAGALALYLERLIVEFHYAMDFPSKAEALQSLYTAYQEAGDRAGMANCKLIEGDNHLSPPFASPITQNLIPLDSAFARGDNNLWDPVEAKITPLKESQEAKNCYDMALKLFQEANCPRGQAAVLLRQGCCSHARACALDTEHPKWYGLVEDAGKKFEEALALFDVDEANAQIVKAHQILLEITKGNHTTDVKRRAADIGKWGREAKNENVSHFVGLLMLRFARREWEQSSRFDASMFGFECAYECGAQLDDIMPVFHSLVARAELHHDMFNASATRIMAERCLSTFDAAVGYFESKIAACPATSIGSLNRKTLLSKKFNLISSFGSVVVNLYARSEDLESYEKWQKRFLDYMEHDESFHMMREHMQSETNSAGNPLPEEHRQSRIEIWDTAMNEQRVFQKYRKADILFQRALLDGDLQKGEDILSRFIDEAAAVEAAKFNGQMTRMLACRSLGDVRKARGILDSVTDAQMFHERMDGFLKGIGLELHFTDTADNAMYACVVAEDWERGARVLGMILKLSPSFLEDAVSHAHRDTAVNLSFKLTSAGLIALHNGQWELAFRRLLRARQIIELRRRQTADVDARVGSLLVTGTVEMFLCLAQLCLLCAEAGLPLDILLGYDHGHPEVSWEEHALLFLEEGRARALLDSLQQSTASEETRSVSENIYKRRALTHLRSLSKRTWKQEEELAQLEAAMEGIELGSWSSSANALMKTVNSSVSPQTLFEHIKEDAIVIEATFSRQGCLIFGVTNKGIEGYHKSSIRDVDIRRPVMEFMNIMRSMTGDKSEAEQQRKDRLDILSRQISDVLLTPFANVIRRKKHVIFSVSHPLTAFPFSALPFNEKPLFLHAAVSQSPSLTVLYHLSRRQAASSTPTVSVFTKSGRSDSEVEGVQSRNVPEEPYLAMAGIEAVNIAHMFSTWPIEASNLTRAEFRDYIKGQASVLHIGTHGNVDHRNPLLSSISIGEDFRVLDMSQIQSNANLLVFAACLSGLGKATIGNDVLGFTHVVLGTGCQAYIGTLWEVSDFASMLLMTIFYRNLKNKPGIPLAEALRRAQIELYQLDTQQAEKFLDEVLEMWNKQKEGGHRSPTDIVPDGEYVLELQKILLPDLDWTSPFFWAPFVLIGYGDFRFGGNSVT
jgi:CHAT domain-containing protein/tetratricopeptide (TPR) repeat protein